MPGKTPYQAFQAFVDPLASAVGCVVRAKFQCSAGGKRRVQADDSEPDHRLTLGQGDYVQLHSDAGIGLLVRMPTDPTVDPDHNLLIRPHQVGTQPSTGPVPAGSVVVVPGWEPSG